MPNKTQNKNISSQIGQGVIEYAVVIILISGILVGVLALTGTNISDVYRKAVNALGNNPSPITTPDPYPADLVTVKVVDAEGIGIQDLRVYKYRSNGSYAGFAGKTTAEGIVEITDLKNGSYKFRADQHATKFWSDIISWPDQHFALITTGETPFPVLVVDGAGMGISGVRVYAYSASGSWAGERGITNSEGEAELLMASGDFKFRAVHQAHDYWSEVIAVSQASSATINTRQQIFPVKVVDAKGKGIPNVRVYSYSGSGSRAQENGYTNSDGIANLQLAEGEFKFRAYYQAHEYWSSVTTVPQAGSARIETGEQTFNVKVVDGQGKGISNITVYTYSSTGSWAGVRGTTGENGIAKLDLSSGEYKFRALHQGHEFWSSSTMVPGTGTVVIQTGQQSFLVKVLGSDKYGISNTRVYTYTDRGSWSGTSVNTGKDGVAELDLSAGSYKFKTHYQGYDFWSGIVTIPDSDSATINIGRQNIIVGVKDRAGNPLSKASILVYTGSGKYTGVWARTAADGSAEISLVNGSFRIRVRSGGKDYWSDPFSLPASVEINIVIN